MWTSPETLKELEYCIQFRMINRDIGAYMHVRNEYLNWDPVN